MKLNELSRVNYVMACAALAGLTVFVFIAPLGASMIYLSSGWSCIFGIVWTMMWYYGIVAAMTYKGPKDRR